MVACSWKYVLEAERLRGIVSCHQPNFPNLAIGRVAIRARTNLKKKTYQN